MTEKSFLSPIKDRVRSSFADAIPEKKDVLDRLWKKLDNIDIDDRSDSFGAFPAYGVITGSWWALETLWCCAYAVAVFKPTLERAINNHQSVIHFKATAEGVIALGLLDWAFAVIGTKERRPWLHSNVSWPYLANGSHCHDGEDLRDADQAFLGAVAWILLHELAHVDLGHEGREGETQEEMEADLFATAWLMDHAPFGTATDRSEGLVTALFYMTAREIIGGVDHSHPIMAERIESSLTAADLHQNAWPICLMATLIDILLQWSRKRNETDRNKEEATCQSYLNEVLAAMRKATSKKSPD